MYSKKTKIKNMQDKNERVALFVHPKYREMLNRSAQMNHRGQRGHVEALIEKDYQKTFKMSLPK